MKDEQNKVRIRFIPSSLRLHPYFWRSELESNQPLGFFKPTLIRLSYPTGMVLGLCSLVFGTSLWACALYEKGKHKDQSPKTKDRYKDLRPFPLAMYLFHNVTIVVHVHEEVLAPLGARLSVVAKHNAFEFHAQR